MSPRRNSILIRLALPAVALAPPVVALALAAVALALSGAACAISTNRAPEPSAKSSAATAPSAGTNATAASEHAPASSANSLAASTASSSATKPAASSAAKPPGVGLRELLASPNPTLRIKGVRMIAEQPPPDAAALLAAALLDTSINVQREAVATMEKLQLTAGLLQGAANPRWQIRLAAIEALGRLRCPAALPVFERQMKDDSYNVRRAMAEAIGRIGDPRGAAMAVDLLSDPASSVRAAAKESVTRLSGDPLADYDPQLPPPRNAEPLKRMRTWLATVKLAPPPAATDQPAGTGVSDPTSDANPALIDPNASTASANPSALRPGVTGPPTPVKIDPATAQLIEALGQPRSPDWQRAVDALVAMKSAVVPALEQSADNSSPAIAETILSEVLPPIDPLYRALRDLRHGPAALRPAAARTVARDSQFRRLPQAAWQQARPAVAEFVALLHDNQPPLRYAAANALGRIGDPSAVAPLEKMLIGREMAGRLAYGAALARLGAESGRDELVRLLAEGTSQMQVEVIAVMADAPHRDYVPPLLARLNPNDALATPAADAALTQITGQDFHYPLAQTREAREQAIAAWQKWFENSQMVTPGATGKP